jgi:hypothetical protein
MNQMIYGRTRTCRRPNYSAARCSHSSAHNYVQCDFGLVDTVNSLDRLPLSYPFESQYLDSDTDPSGESKLEDAPDSDTLREALLVLVKEIT